MWNQANHGKPREITQNHAKPSKTKQNQAKPRKTTSNYAKPRGTTQNHVGPRGTMRLCETTQKSYSNLLKHCRSKENAKSLIFKKPLTERRRTTTTK